MAVSTPVSPLYKPGAPPPPLFLLTSQMDVSYNPFHSGTLTAHEELPTNSPKRHNSVPAIPRSSSAVRFHSLPPRQTDSIPEDLESALTELTSDSGSDSDSDELEGIRKISKPQGEAGRPGRGGYTLQVALGWDAKNHKKLSVRTASLPLDFGTLI